MKGITKILLAAGAGLALWYGPTLLAIYNLDFSIAMVIPTQVSQSSITALVTVKLKNNSGTTLNITNILSNIYLNGVHIATMNQAETMTLLGNSEQNFNIVFTVDTETITTDILKQLVAQNLLNSVVNIQGNLTANNKNIPYNMYYTIKDL